MSVRRIVNAMPYTSMRIYRDADVAHTHLGVSRTDARLLSLHAVAQAAV
jgi:hypothetical protein